MTTDLGTKPLLQKYQQLKTTEAGQSEAPTQYRIARQKEHEYPRKALFSQAGDVR